jgi:exo-beta-1,3-glucanase (GH17 family)
MANDHPWFANVSIDQAAGWTYQFFEETNVAAAANVSNHPTMYIAETGWPSVQIINHYQLSNLTTFWTEFVRRGQPE